MIIKDFPTSWQDLQIKVASILSECGFKTEVEKTIKSARGSVEVDVYAEETIDGRKYSILCECKYWNSKIPQTVIHGFRTVINDLGCNAGYIITTSDFQSGAFLAIDNTNIELLSWQAFQARFFESWYCNSFFKKLQAILRSDYDQTSIQLFENFELINKSDYKELINKYENLQELKILFPYPWLKEFQDDFRSIGDKLPIAEKQDTLPEWEKINLPDLIIKETNYSKLLSSLKDFASPIYSRMDEIGLGVGGFNRLTID